MSAEEPVLVFIGQPNCGKSTLFNALAGFKAEVSNFPGTTVKHTHSTVRIEGWLIHIIDLPGTYSLNPSDPAEKVALTHLFGEKPDVIINVVDASLLGRSLELTFELLELNEPMVVALNMMDEARRKGMTIGVEALQARLGVPVVPLVARRGEGVKEMLDRALELVRQPALAPIQRLSDDVERAVAHLDSVLPEDFTVRGNRRFTAIKMIEASGLFFEKALDEADPALKQILDRIRAELESQRGRPAYEIIAAERHHLAQKTFENCCRLGRRESGLDWKTKLDAVLIIPSMATESFWRSSLACFSSSFAWAAP